MTTPRLAAILTVDVVGFSRLNGAAVAISLHPAGGCRIFVQVGPRARSRRA